MYIFSISTDTDSNYIQLLSTICTVFSKKSYKKGCKLKMLGTKHYLNCYIFTIICQTTSLVIYSQLKKNININKYMVMSW